MKTTFNKLLNTHISKNDQVIFILLLLFFIIRVLFIIVFSDFTQFKDREAVGDDYGYSMFALEINNGFNWLFFDTKFSGSHREPGYPFFVALIYFVFGLNNFLAVYIIQAALSTLMLLYIYKSSLLIFSNNKAALLALIWGGVTVVYMRYNGTILRETIIYFLMVLLFYRFLLTARKHLFTVKEILILAILYTLLFHTDGRYLFYAPFLFIIFYLYQKGLLLAIKKFFLFALFVGLLTIPWGIRNYIAYRDIIIVSRYTISLTGEKSYERGEHFVTKSIDSLYSTTAFKYNKKYPTEVERLAIKSGKNPNNRPAGEIELIKRNEYPAKTYLGRKWFFIKKMWQPYKFSSNYGSYPWALFYKPWSLKHNLSSILNYGILLPFFFFGIFILIKNRNKYWLIIILPIIVHFVLHALTFGLQRYRYPIDAFIIIIGTFGIVYVYNLLFIRKSKI
jgi:hypothetical protein